ncbi:hypothetical protein AB4K20DRAFT_1906615 [Rhizopus microsporus]
METFCQVFSVYDPAIVGQIINTNGRFSTFQIVQTFIILYLFFFSFSDVFIFYLFFALNVFSLLGV